LLQEDEEGRARLQRAQRYIRVEWRSAYLRHHLDLCEFFRRIQREVFGLHEASRDGSAVIHA
jgi:hypothetical protein